jgi:hypothetical protein
MMRYNLSGGNPQRESTRELSTQTTLGLVLVIIAVVSLIVSAGGVIAIWNAHPAINTALADTCQLVLRKQRRPRRKR